MISVTSDTMSTVTVQESCEVKSEVRKTRLGLSLSERIKVIEARQMGKSMRQVLLVLSHLNKYKREIHYLKLLHICLVGCSVWLRENPNSQYFGPKRKVYL